MKASLFIKNWLLQIKLKKLKSKFSFKKTKLKNTKLLLEEHVSISSKNIEGGDKSIGAYTYIRSGGEIYGKVNIGRFCSIGNGVIIGLSKHQHPIDWVSTSLFSTQLENTYKQTYKHSPTSIGNDCWVGRNAVIMSGIKIGNGVIIGYGSIVTKDIPDYAVVAGNPAVLIKLRFTNEIRSALLKSQWWNLDINLLPLDKFNDPEDFIEKINSLDLKSTHYNSIIFE